MFFKATDINVQIVHQSCLIIASVKSTRTVCKARTANIVRVNVPRTASIICHQAQTISGKGYMCSVGEGCGGFFVGGGGVSAGTFYEATLNSNIKVLQHCM